ncbi:MAG: DNA polymerase III subunit delta, partial [Lachnospiraceae bacterium]|nr:DNA polymerase III subunit delta [Lachnospiraceae bacterium]
KRLILLENTGWGKKGAEGLARDIPDLPDSTVLVLLEAEAAEKAPLFQAASQFGLCVLCEAPSRQEVKNDCRQAFESRGYEIEGAALDLFYERCGGDLATMEGEKEKLMAYVLPEKMIRRSHVETITHQTTTGRVFDMIHAMARGRTGEAFRLYEDLKTLKEAPSGILSLIVNQVGQLYAIRELDERGMSQREIEGLTRFNSYAVKAGIPRSRAFSSRLWKKKWERCLEYELASRSGRMEAEIAVELALIEMSLR